MQPPCKANNGMMTFYNRGRPVGQMSQSRRNQVAQYAGWHSARVCAPQVGLCKLTRPAGIVPDDESCCANADQENVMAI